MHVLQKIPQLSNVYNSSNFHMDFSEKSLRRFSKDAYRNLKKNHNGLFQGVRENILRICKNLQELRTWRREWIDQKYVSQFGVEDSILNSKYILKPSHSSTHLGWNSSKAHLWLLRFRISQPSGLVRIRVQAQRVLGNKAQFFFAPVMTTRLPSVCLSRRGDGIWIGMVPSTGSVGDATGWRRPAMELYVPLLRPTRHH